MKFTCDSCGSAYMIPDDKVGPAGVKVRCKKCGNVVTVRRPEAVPAPAPAPAPAPPAATPDEQPQGGLDDELGAAFDHAFGGPAAPAPAPAPAPVAAAPAAPVAPTEWFVGIGDAQVGPMPVAEVKRRWESSELGPDSLVWCAGMADWAPLSSVAELAAAVSPPPQSAPAPAPAPAAQPAALPSLPEYDAPVAPAAPVAPVASSVAAWPAPAPLEPRAPAAPAPAPAPAAAPEVEWKPAGASALASLASEELAAREAAAAPVTPRVAPGRSLVDQLPDSGGVDPTGVLPLPIKGMEATEERPVRKSSVARGSEAMRQQRSSRTALLAGGGVALVAVAGLAAWLLIGRAPPPGPAPAPPLPVAAAPAAPPPAAPAAAAAAPETAAATPAPTPTSAVEPPLPSGEKAGEKGAPAATAATAKPKETPKPPAAPAPAKVAAKAPAPKATVPAEPPAPAAAPAPKTAAKKKDPVLDFDQGAEDDLAAALGGTKKNVYVPPKAGAAAPPAPERLSDAQITESVRLHVDALRRCAAEQQAREPGAKGTLKMAWTIQPDGAPKDVRCLTPELAQGPFAACISGVVRGIRFPRVGDARGQPVTFPFGF